MPPPLNPMSEPADLLDFGPMDVDTKNRSTNRIWSAAESGDYFLKDKLHILSRIAEATHTDVSVVANSDSVQIRLTGLTGEDVEEAIEKLQGSVEFIVRSNSLFPSG